MLSDGKAVDTVFDNNDKLSNSFAKSIISNPLVPALMMFTLGRAL